MSHFAQLDKNNNVINVTAVDNHNICDENGIENEEIGIKFLKKIFGQDTIWVQASYNANIRRYFPSIGWKYDKELNIFIPPKPFNSWNFNEKTGYWEPPIPSPPIEKIDINSPTPPKVYMWDEDNMKWY